MVRVGSARRGRVLPALMVVVLVSLSMWAPFAPTVTPAAADASPSTGCADAGRPMASCDEVLGSPLNGIQPARLLDTRPGSMTADGRNAGSGALRAGETLTLPVTSRGGVPWDAAAVAVNVTAIAPSADGFVTIYPCGAERPNASSLNFRAGQTVGNSASVRIGDGGAICLFSMAATDLAVDVSGWSADGGGFRGITPARLLDTRPGATTVDGRSAGVGHLESGQTLTLQVRGRAGIDDTAAAASLNVTVADPRADGFLTIYPCDRERPNTSGLNYRRGLVAGNAAVAALSSTGTICIYALAATDVIVDVNGTYDAETGFQGLAPLRLLDTRPGAVTADGAGAGAGRAAAGSVVVVPVAGRAGIAADAAAVAINVTAVLPGTDGFVTVFPCGQDRPNASSLNFAAGSVAGNGAGVLLGASGAICVFTMSPTDLVVDVTAVLATTPLPRSDVDRPGPNVWDVKPLYVTLRNGPDDHRDTDGSIDALTASMMSWYQHEYPGYTLRLDTYAGRPDITHVALPYTADEYAQFSLDHMNGLADALTAAGFPVPRSSTSGSMYGNNHRLYLVFIEGPRGWYQNMNGLESASCGNTTDLSSNGVVGLHLRANDGTPCPHEPLRPLVDPSSGNWDLVRLMTHALRAMPGCSSVLEQEFATPWLERPGQLAPANDAIKTGGDRDAHSIPRLDPAHRYYFRITDGPWAADGCRDIAASPYWQPRWGRGSGAALARSNADRPDDVDGPQVKVFYVLPSDAPDDGWDLGRLDLVAGTVDRWLAAQTGRTIRWDTFEGHLDVTFVRLAETNEQMWNDAPPGGGDCTGAPCPSDLSLQPRLAAMGLSSPTKAQIVVYGGTYNPAKVGDLCGGGGATRTSILFLGRRDASGRLQCVPGLETGLPAVDNSLGLVAVHELFHTLGAVPDGAPDGQYGHIVGDPNDLMATYPRNGFTAFTVDAHHRNYFGHSNPGLVDLEDSVFLAPAPAGASFPPRWNA